MREDVQVLSTVRGIWKNSVDSRFIKRDIKRLKGKWGGLNGHH